VRETNLLRLTSTKSFVSANSLIRMNKLNIDGSLTSQPPKTLLAL